MTRTACAAIALLSCVAFDPAAFAQAGPDATPAEAAAATPDAAPVDAADKDKPKAETIYVFGRSTELIGEAKSASEGVVGEADFETRPLLRPGELAEVIPGMIAAQRAGGGKANQYFLRGFNLDHGTDFA
ncbi:MAG: TonB-dependent receptor, partial [Alphaproteobacteria bacterium]